MNRKVIRFDDTEIEEHEFHQYKSHISLNNLVLNNH